MEPQACVALLAGLAEALCSIHRAGLIHRDLKPSNVILGPHGPKVLDFGIARLLTAADQTLTKGIIGTPAYMAPEQIRGDKIGPACDVWALAATAAFAATGHSPFEDASIETTIHNVLSRPPNIGDVPSELLDVLTECLNKQPQLRPSAEQLLIRFPPSPAVHPPSHPADSNQEPKPPRTESSHRTRPVPAPSTHGPTYAYEPVPATKLEPPRRTQLDDATPRPLSVGTAGPVELEQQRPPWRSVPTLLTTIIVAQVVLGLAVVVRDVLTTKLLSNGLLRTEFDFMDDVYLNQFRITDAVLFALACGTTILTATVLIRTVYASKGWRTWTLTAAIITLIGYTINAMDLPTRLITHIVFPGDSDNDPKLTLDQATTWYTVIAANVTLLSLACSMLVIAAARQPR